MNGKIVWAIIVLIGLSVFTFISINSYNENKTIVRHRIYEGRIYLMEQEYEEFKIFLADNQDIEIEELDAYSSPNTLIEMKLKVPPTQVIPYDIKETKVYIANLEGFILGFVCSIAVVILLLWLGFSAIEDERKESRQRK